MALKGKVWFWVWNWLFRVSNSSRHSYPFPTTLCKCLHMWQCSTIIPPFTDYFPSWYMTVHITGLCILYKLMIFLDLSKSCWSLPVLLEKEIIQPLDMIFISNLSIAGFTVHQRVPQIWHQMKWLSTWRSRHLCLCFPWKHHCLPGSQGTSCFAEWKEVFPLKQTSLKLNC